MFYGLTPSKCGCERQTTHATTRKAHDTPTPGGASGQATDVEIRANELLRWKRELTEIYEKNTGQPLQKLKDDMERDKFMNAEEAVAYGLVDKIITNRADDNRD